VSGILFVVLGAGIIVWTWPPTWWQWGLGVLLIAGGGFQIFEALAGWCAVRAMGFRTRI